MTTAMLAPFRPGAVMGGERASDGILAKATAKLAAYVEYRSTLDALRKLTERQLADLGFAGRDLSRIARDATYGA